MDFRRAIHSPQCPKPDKALAIFRLANELTGIDGGFVILRPERIALMEAVREREDPAFERAAALACAARIMRGKVAGVIAVLGPECSDVLAAIALQFEDLKTENGVQKALAPPNESGIVAAAARACSCYSEENGKSRNTTTCPSPSRMPSWTES